MRRMLVLLGIPAVAVAFAASALANGSNDVSPTTVASTTTPAPSPDPAPKPSAPAKPRVVPNPPPPVTNAQAHVTKARAHATDCCKVASTPEPPSSRRIAPRRIRPHTAPHRRRSHHELARPRAPVADPFAPRIPEVSGALGVSVTVTRTSPQRALVVLLLTLSLLACATACVPAQSVPWRAGASFLYDRRLGVTLAGLALLALGCTAMLAVR